MTKHSIIGYITNKISRSVSKSKHPMSPSLTNKSLASKRLMKCLLIKAYIMRHWQWIDKHPYSNPRVYDLISRNYLLLKILGTGHFSTVFLARNIHVKNYVALKFLKPSYSINSLNKDKLLLEGRILFELNEHPNIINVRAYIGKDEHHGAYLVLDYIAGQTLQSKHPKGVPIELPTVIHYVTQIASALDYAHEHRILHRDLKQNNIMITATQDIILLDFGLSADETNSDSELPNGSSIGFPETMAPERWDYRSQKESDVYALGVIIFELLTGQKLFEGTQDELEEKHRNIKPPSLHDLNPDIPEEISMVVLKALAKKPEDRYSSAGKLAEALETALMVAVAKAFTAMATALQQAILRRNRMQLAMRENAIIEQNRAVRRKLLFVLGAAITVSAGELIFHQLIPPERAKPMQFRLSEDERSFRPGLLLSTYNNPNQAPIGAALWLPNDSHILLNTVQNGRIISIDTNRQQGIAEPSRYMLPDSEEQIATVSLQRTKDYLAAVTSSGGVYFWQMDTQTLLSTPKDYPTIVKKAVISPDGLHVALVTRNNELLIFDAPRYYQQGGLDRLYRHDDEITSLSWSFDSQYIVFGSSDRTVRVIHRINPELLWIFKGHKKEVTDVAFAPYSLNFISSGMDRRLNGWNLFRRQPIFSFKDHKQGVLSVAWSTIGDQIASGSLDQTVKIYDIYNSRNKSIYTLEHGQPVTMLSWGTSRIVAVGTDTMKVWQTGFYPN